MRYAILVIAGCAFASVYADTRRPATEVEIQLIRTTLGLDEIPAWKHYKVLDVEGSYIVHDNRPERELRGIVWFQPYLIQDALCLMEVFYKTGYESDAELDWQPTFYVYHYWPAQSASDCELSDSSERPVDSIWTNSFLAAAALVQIIYRADELLGLTLDYAINEVDYEAQYPAGSDVPARRRGMFRDYRNDSTMRLISVEQTRETLPGRGFAYTAHYGGGGSQEGPAVTFSVTPPSFTIHSVSYWIE